MITFVDLTERKQAADAVNKARLHAESIVATVREPLVVLDGSLRVRSTNPSFSKLFQVAPEEVENRLLFELGNREWDLPELRRMLEEILPRSAEVIDFEITQTFAKIGQRTMLIMLAQPQPEDRPTLIPPAIEDITERKRAEQELKPSIHPGIAEPTAEPNNVPRTWHDPRVRESRSNSSDHPAQQSRRVVDPNESSWFTTPPRPIVDSVRPTCPVNGPAHGLFRPIRYRVLTPKSR